MQGRGRGSIAKTAAPPSSCEIHAVGRRFAAARHFWIHARVHTRMASRRRHQPRHNEARIRRWEAWKLLGMGSVFVLFAISVLAYVAGSLRAGFFDNRPRGSPRDMEPIFLTVGEDPFEFYFALAFLAAMALGMLYIGVGMARQAIAESRGKW